MSLTIKQPFGRERLDDLDRKMLTLMGGHGREGQSFNKLVAEAKPFASRSTFALRVKRLERLNCIERFPDAENRQAVRIRARPIVLMLTRVAVRMNSKCSELERAVMERARSLEGKKALTADEVRTARDFVEEKNREIKDVYSLIGTYAVNFGEGLAGDLLLPMVISNFRSLNSALVKLLTSNQQLRRILTDDRLGALSMDSMREDFRYAFGTEMNRALPNFTKRMESLTRKRARRTGMK